MVIHLNNGMKHGAVLAAWAAMCGGAVWALAPQVAYSQPLSAGAVFEPTAVARFAINGFSLTGENPLGVAESQRILAPYIRPDATLETLQKAALALETALRDKGFGLYRVALPPQQISETVALTLVKFSLGKITVEGNSQYDLTNIRSSLPELQEGGTPNFQRLAVQTAIANENPGKQIQIAVKESAVPDTLDAHLVVKETSPWQVSATASNAGSAATGRDRVTVAAGYANLFKLDHQLAVAYTTSLAQTSNVKQLGVSYRAPLYAQRGVIGASYTHSDVVGSFGSFTSTGAGQTMGVNYSYYFAPHQGYRSYGVVGLDDKQFDPSKINGTPLVGQVLRRSRQLSVGYVGRYESDSAAWGYNAELATNLPGGQGNNVAAYQSEDPRITSARWKALRAGASYTANFLSNWRWSLRGNAQYSPDALISGEQFGLGGMASVRGTSERPLAGDRGMLSTLEISTPETAPGLRFVGFVDAGWLSNNTPNGTTKPGSDRLSSAGLGLRYATPRVALSADYGRLFRGSVVPLTVNSFAPQKGDSKLHVNLTAHF